MLQAKPFYLNGHKIETESDVRKLPISRRAQNNLIRILTKKGVIKDVPDSLKEHWKRQDEKRKKFMQNPYSVT